MEVVENNNSTGGTLVLDDKFFVGCHYNGTVLLYSGGEVSSKDTRFENCPLQFSGAAARTVALLTSMGVIKPGMLPPGSPTPSGKPQ